LTVKREKKGKKRPCKFRPDKKTLETIIRRVQLVDIILLDSSTKRIKEDINYNDLTIQTKSIAQTGEEEPPGKTFMGICEFGVRGMLENEGVEPIEAFIIEGSFLLTYILKDREGITTDDIASFVVINGEHQVWPFWRELVHNMSSRMGIEPITLPIRQPRYKLSELVIEETEDL